jgi:hypothetical protein
MVAYLASSLEPKKRRCRVVKLTALVLVIAGIITAVSVLGVLNYQEVMRTCPTCIHDDYHQLDPEDF